METERFEESREKRVKLWIVGNGGDFRQSRQKMMKREIRRRSHIKPLIEEIELLDLSNGCTVDEGQPAFV